MKNKKYRITLYILGVFIFLIIGYVFLFSPPQTTEERTQFTVGINDDTSEVAQNLYSQGFVRSLIGYKIAYLISGGHFIAIDEIQPGAYRLSKGMNSFEIAKELLQTRPYMKWVIIPEGFRKEQVADILYSSLDWTLEDKEDWLNIYTERSPEYREGVYFPDSYLIPVDESPEEVTERFIDKFNENFKEFSEEASDQNIIWTTLINIASLIQREGIDSEDMPIISGVIWNRLLDGMKLDIDATIQYVKGDESDWWPQIRPEDKNIDSPFNTYMYTGLPPHPIANPGVEAIEAALHPEETDCFYYLHDSEGDIYCSENYEEHQEKIEKYL